ncbi:sensor histidine kinase [Vallitalea pronyensis]|uniref:histidine kinase n=1 Tax=Vallitalea pronyensis TaxID=1348613 RepID=A0A8J8MLG1_9FIRM|nr:sensor histidine kinase [Vallitalea pronyensis]QUI24032.1 sensor histidine kinase [Vallitalea pronyensis]
MVNIFKSIRTKLVLGCLCLSVIPIFLITGMLYLRSVTIIEQNTANSMMLNLERHSEKADELFMNTYYDLVNFTFNHTLREAISEGDHTTLQKMLHQHAVVDTFLDSVYLFLPKEGKLVSSMDGREVKYIEDLDALGKTIPKVNQNNWIETFEYQDNLFHHKDYHFAIKKKIYDPDKEEVVGIVIANVDERKIYFNLLHDLKRHNNDNIFLLNSKNMIVSTKFKNEIGRAFTLDKSMTANYSAKDAHMINIKGEKYLIVYHVSGLTKYKMVYMVPQKVIVSDVEDIKYVALGLSIIVLLAVGVLWYMLTMDIYRPISKMESHMKAVGQGNFDIQIPSARNDELGVLIKGFNSMTSKLNHLFNEVYRSKYQKKEAELKALQSQITPHFLYNTLNSIRCVAILQNAKTVSSMLGSLIELLQGTVGNKHVYITLEEEIQQVDHYVKLQQFRYNDAFSVTYDLEDNVKQYKLPKLILQPLVENSLQHGLDLRGKEAHIGIQAFEKDGKLVIYVVDNGRGITVETVEKIFNGEMDKTRKFSGIGINNVDERIKLYFGDEYGLTYLLDEKSGTKAMIKLPIIMSDEKGSVMIND